ncbi:MAG: hypothetical protein WA964_12295 [Ilumatobacter sp.]|uniref:hypothetical protein n=1 Tax=Ilumatobacter sp. TaxID=1967498 RepID=UPI003C757DFC
MAVTPIEVFVAAGADRWHETQALRGHEAVRLAATPRHATVLLIAGTIPEAHREALDRVHDQVPHPRTLVTWEDVEASGDIEASGGMVDAIARSILDHSEALSADPSTSSPGRLADEEPNEWRGIGPFGQGGEGMMGGTPYGRAMAMTADDRDGLTLDQINLQLGPFAGQLPGGLVADVALQGEVVQSIEFAVPGDAIVTSADRHLTVTRRLQWLSHALHVQGLDPFAARAAGLARRSESPDRDTDLGRAFERMRRRLRWTGLHSALRGVGPHGGHDTWARWTTHLDAISAGLGDTGSRTSTPPETPTITAAELAATITGLTLTDAVSTIIGFDIDVPATTTATVER